MDKHLNILAKRHLETKIVKVRLSRQVLAAYANNTCLSIIAKTSRRG
jgi:hypothetical protein